VTNGFFGSLVDYFMKGGIVMWPLLICSIVGLVFVIERGIFFHRLRISPQGVFGSIRERVRARDLDGAIQVTSDKPGHLSDILKAGLLRFGKPHEEILRALESVSLHEISKMERGLWILATIANVAPLLGFLGTVVGMIDSFAVLSSVGFGNPKLVARGIAEALITTAAGLFIAFPIQVAYNYFTTRVNSQVMVMETTSAMLLETFSELEDQDRAKA